MISVVPYPGAPEYRREALALGHLVFCDPLVAALGLANDEFTDLPWISRSFAQLFTGTLTCSSVSVMVDRLTRA